MSSCSRARHDRLAQQSLAGFNLAQRDLGHPERVQHLADDHRQLRRLGDLARALGLDDRLPVVAAQRAGTRDPGEQSRTLGARLVRQQRQRAFEVLHRRTCLVEPPAGSAPAHQQARVAHRVLIGVQQPQAVLGQHLAVALVAVQRVGVRGRLEQLDLVDPATAAASGTRAHSPCARS